MPFSGKATYTAGPELPEIAEDVSDVIGLVSPFETPLLDHLGDASRPATSTIHEWLEDHLLPNRDRVDDDTILDPLADTTFGVENASFFRAGDQIRLEGTRELMLVTGTDEANATITVVRGYGGTAAEPLVDDAIIHILGNAALEGADAPNARFTNRVRRVNYTQIFTAAVEVSGSQLATNALGVDDELDYQRQQRLRELLRDLENMVINGAAPVVDPQGSATTRRTMNGVINSIATNTFEPGVGPIPPGGGVNADLLTEEVLNAALRRIWEDSAGAVDTIVVNGFQKRQLNSIIQPSRRFGPDDERFRDLLAVYESDFGVCRVVLSRWVPADTALLLDSSRIDVPPLAGRSFHYKPLSSRGDHETGELIGEYTLEFRNEQAHGLIQKLGTAA
ncbi:MAG: DUF5309 family protein [Phycisphaerales bacterium]